MLLIWSLLHGVTSVENAMGRELNRQMDRSHQLLQSGIYTRGYRATRQILTGALQHIPISQQSWIMYKNKQKKSDSQGVSFDFQVPCVHLTSSCSSFIHTDHHLHHLGIDWVRCHRPDWGQLHHLPGHLLRETCKTIHIVLDHSRYIHTRGHWPQTSLILPSPLMLDFCTVHQSNLLLLAFCDGAPMWFYQVAWTSRTALAPLPT